MSHLFVLDAPDLSQCLNNIMPAKYDNTLVLKCYVPGNPDLDVKCDLLGESNVVLRSEGKCVYSLQFNYYKMLILKDRFYFFSSAFTWAPRKIQNRLYILFKAARLEQVRLFIYFELYR